MGFESVSYTHLDVYKRQGEWAANGPDYLIEEQDARRQNRLQQQIRFYTNGINLHLITFHDKRIKSNTLKINNSWKYCSITDSNQRVAKNLNPWKHRYVTDGAQRGGVTLYTFFTWHYIVTLLHLYLHLYWWLVSGGGGTWVVPRPGSATGPRPNAWSRQREEECSFIIRHSIAVSYTHLDVYKRQE